jgi:hypothetical protein
MRADIAASAVFPDYELIDHTGKRRKLSDLQGQIPSSWCLAGADTARGICARPRVNTQYIMK